MTETFPPAGGPALPGSPPEYRRRLVMAGAALALSVALLGGYLILGGSGGDATTGPVPHAVRSPRSVMPATQTPARPPLAKPSPSVAVARNPFLPLVVAAPAGTTADAATGSGTPGTGTGTDIAGSPSPTPADGGTTGTGTTGTGTTGTGTTGTGGSDGGAAAPVDGNPNFTG